MCKRVGKFCRGIWTGWISGLRPFVWGSTWRSAKSCSWITATPGSAAAGCGQGGWQAACWDRTWVCWSAANLTWTSNGQVAKKASGFLACIRISNSDKQDQGRDCSPVLGSGADTPWVPCSILGPSLQGRHWGAGACPEKGRGAGEGSREKALWGVTEVARAV